MHMLVLIHHCTLQQQRRDEASRQRIDSQLAELDEKLRDARAGRQETNQEVMNYLSYFSTTITYYYYCLHVTAKHLNKHTYWQH
jgi:hypothetical protein